jgi:hypothetical protein
MLPVTRISLTVESSKTLKAPLTQDKLQAFQHTESHHSGLRVDRDPIKARFSDAVRIVE